MPIICRFRDLMPNRPKCCWSRANML